MRHGEYSSIDLLELENWLTTLKFPCIFLMHPLGEESQHTRTQEKSGPHRRHAKAAALRVNINTDSCMIASHAASRHTASSHATSLLHFSLSLTASPALVGRVCLAEQLYFDYKEVSAEVLAELPRELQEEIRNAVRLAEQAAKSKQGIARHSRNAPARSGKGGGGGGTEGVGIKRFFGKVERGAEGERAGGERSSVGNGSERAEGKRQKSRWERRARRRGAEGIASFFVSQQHEGV